VRNTERRIGDGPQSGRSAQPDARHHAALDIAEKAGFVENDDFLARLVTA
jgi:hypothetical protein